MAIQLSVAVRNARLDAIETAIGASAILKIRTGAVPANCGAADSGTVLATIALPADWMASAAAGSKAMTGTWQDSSADASGLAAHYRIYASDGVTCHLQGLVSQPWAGSAAFALNQQVHNGGNVYKCTTAGTSAASGGPSGTGSGITDGSAVWTYVGTQDMGLDNTNIAVTQPVAINTYTLTDANA